MYLPEDCLTNIKLRVVNSGFDLTVWNAVMKTFATDLSFSDLMLGDCNWTQFLDPLVHKRALNGWVFIYELSDCGFKSSCNHSNFRFRACFEQRVPWHSGNIECGFTLTCVHHMTRTYSLMLGVEGRKLLLKKNYPKP